jgi:glycosyltransferase involved in cell wall biosynthesis
VTHAPDITVVVCTYQQPRHLALCLESIARQAGVDGRFELIVTDDGSVDDTALIVDALSRRVPFPVKFVTAEHHGCRGRCRNAGILAAAAPYLLLTDGDCVLPPDHVRIHLLERRPKTVNAGNPVRLTAAQSECADSFDFDRLRRVASWRERWRVARDDFDARVNWLVRNPHRPKLICANMAAWRADLDSVNGFDETLVAWGGDDDDLRMRMRQAGIRIRSISRKAPTFHLWHPRDPVAQLRWTERPNAPYLQRPSPLTRCVDGLIKQRAEDL